MEVESSGQEQLGSRASIRHSAMPLTVERYKLVTAELREQIEHLRDELDAAPDTERAVLLISLAQLITAIDLGFFRHYLQEEAEHLSVQAMQAVDIPLSPVFSAAEAPAFLRRTTRLSLGQPITHWLAFSEVLRARLEKASEIHAWLCSQKAAFIHAQSSKIGKLRNGQKGGVLNTFWTTGLAGWWAQRKGKQIERIGLSDKIIFSYVYYMDSFFHLLFDYESIARELRDRR